MIYEQYEARMLRIAAVLQFIKRIRALLIGGFLVLLSAIATLVICQGMIISDIKAPESPFYYGSVFEPSAKAFLGEVSFEYTAKGKEEWSAEKPILPGTYFARAVSVRTLGRTTYGDFVEFSILPSALTVKPTPTMAYGDEPSATAVGLLYGDKLAGFSTVEDDPTLASPVVSIPKDSVLIVNENGEDVTWAYDITSESGTVVMTPRPIKLVFDSAEKVYDGAPLMMDSYQIAEGSLVGTDYITMSGFPALTDVVSGGIPNVAESIIFYDTNGYNISAKYELTVEVGTLLVHPCPITVRTESVSKPYDGMPLTGSSFTLVSGSLRPGETLKLESKSELVLVGSSENLCTFSVWEGLKNVSANYRVTCESGTLTVTPREVILKATDYTWYYDGRVHSGNDLFPMYALSPNSPNTILSGHKVTLSSDSFINGVGTKENRITGARVYDEHEQDITYCYSVTYESGTLTVLPRVITIVAPSATFRYDGTRHGAELLGQYTSRLGDAEGNVSLPIDNGDVIDLQSLGFEDSMITNDGVIMGHVLFFELQGSITNVGTTESMIVNPSIWVGDLDVTQNYEIHLVGGQIEVLPRTISISTTSAIWVYDGKYHSGANIAEQYSSLLYTPYMQDAPDWPMPEIEVGDGYIADYVKETEDMPDIIFEPALVGGHTIHLTFDSSIRDVGEVQNTFSSWTILDENGNDVTANYDLSVLEYGILKVIPRRIDIIASNITWEYDGYEHGPQEIVDAGDLPYRLELIDALSAWENPFTRTDVSAEDVYPLPEGFTIEVETYGTITEIGQTKHYVNTFRVLDREGNDVTENFMILTRSGMLEITKRRVVISANNAEKFFDGTALVDAGIFFELGSLAPMHTIESTVEGSQFAIGSSENLLCKLFIYDRYGNVVLSYDRETGIVESEYYEAAILDGTLTVKENPGAPWITVSPYEIHKSYTGEIVSCSKDQIWIVDGREFFPKGYRIEAVIDGYGLEIGEHTTTITEIHIYDAAGNDVTRQFNCIMQEGKIDITKIKIRVVSGSAYKVYDGEELVHDEWTLKFGDLLDGHTLEVEIVGSIINPGSVKNEIASYTITDENGNDVSMYYDVTATAGTLTVLPALE